MRRKNFLWRTNLSDTCLDKAAGLQQSEYCIEEPRMTTAKKKWVRNVKTDSTHPPEGLFTKSPAIIARTLASPKVSPKGPQSGMRMLTYFINRAGKGLSASRRANLERAKELLSKRIQMEKRAS
jgi:hypothetical protein